MSLEFEQLEKRVSNLEEVTRSLNENLVTISNNIQAIRRDLVGSSDSLVEGALPELRSSAKGLNLRLEVLEKKYDDLVLLERDVNYHTRKLDKINKELEIGLFTGKQKEETLEFISIFKGSNKILWGILALLPIIFTIINAYVVLGK